MPMAARADFSEKYLTPESGLPKAHNLSSVLALSTGQSPVASFVRLDRSVTCPTKTDLREGADGAGEFAGQPQDVPPGFFQRVLGVVERHPLPVLDDTRFFDLAEREAAL